MNFKVIYIRNKTIFVYYKDINEEDLNTYIRLLKLNNQNFHVDYLIFYKLQENIFTHLIFFKEKKIASYINFYPKSHDYVINVLKIKLDITFNRKKGIIINITSNHNPILFFFKKNSFGEVVVDIIDYRNKLSYCINSKLDILYTNNFSIPSSPFIKKISVDTNYFNSNNNLECIDNFVVWKKELLPLSPNFNYELVQIINFYFKEFQILIDKNIDILKDDNTNILAQSFPHLIIISKEMVQFKKSFIIDFLAHEIAHQIFGNKVLFVDYAARNMMESLVEFMQMVYLKENYPQKIYNHRLKKLIDKSKLIDSIPLTIDLLNLFEIDKKIVICFIHKISKLKTVNNSTVKELLYELNNSYLPQM